MEKFLRYSKPSRNTDERIWFSNDEKFVSSLQRGFCIQRDNDNFQILQISLLVNKMKIYMTLICMDWVLSPTCMAFTTASFVCLLKYWTNYLINMLIRLNEITNTDAVSEVGNILEISKKPHV